MYHGGPEVSSLYIRFHQPENTWKTMDRLHRELLNSFSFIYKMFKIEREYIRRDTASLTEINFLDLIDEFESYYKRLEQTTIPIECDEQTKCTLMDETNDCTHHMLDKILLISDNLLISGRYSTYTNLNVLINSLSQALEKHGRC